MRSRRGRLCSPGDPWFSSPADAAARLAEPATSPTRPPPRRRTSPGARRSRCWSRGRPGSARPSWPRRSARADGRRAGAAAVLRGPRRGAGALRVELQEAAAAHPGRRSGDDQSLARRPHDDIFTEEFLLTRPLLTAIRRDAADRAAGRRGRQDRRRGRGPAAGGPRRTSRSRSPSSARSSAVRRPFVVLTSNASRELSEALKRRCLYLHLDYPDAAREREIVTSQVPDLDDRIAAPARRHRRPAARPGAEEGAVDRRVRRLGAHPGGAGDRRPRRGRRSTETLGVVLKHASDHERAVQELKLAAGMTGTRAVALIDRTSPSWRRCAARACRSRWPRTSTRSPRCSALDWGDRDDDPARRTPPPW